MMNHLTDDQIQSYLDGEYQSDQSDIENHLNTCIDCQMSLNEYKELFNAVQMQSAPTLSGDFSKKIIARLNDAKDKKWRIFENAVVVFIMITGIFSVIYFSNLINITGYFKTIDFSVFSDIGNKLNSNFFGNFSYILIAAIVTIIIELTDRIFIKKPQRQPGHS